MSQGEGKAQPTCPVEAVCGGCQTLGTPYAYQLAGKQDEVAALFEALPEARGAIQPIIGMEDPFRYRNKIISPFVAGKRKKGKGRAAGEGARKGKPAKGQAGASQREILCGMYAAGTHKVAPVDECLIEHPLGKRVIHAIRDLMPKYRIEPYDEDTGKGFLRHAVVRVGHARTEVLVTLVTNGSAFPGAKKFVRELVEREPAITTVVQNVNTRMTNVILGQEETVLYGPGFILDRLCGLSFRISSQSFYQVNPRQTEVLYRRAIELAHMDGSETVLDAYCGTGTIGLIAAAGVDGLAGAGAVYGIDSTPAAIRDARNNAKHNGIENARFIVGDAGAFMREQAKGATQGDSPKSLARGIDVVFMDPPRSGASEEFLDALAALAPSRVVYISCNPKTQVRDCARLIGSGYRLEAVQPVDMFPHTAHVECVALLTKA